MLVRCNPGLGCPGFRRRSNMRIIQTMSATWPCTSPGTNKHLEGNIPRRSTRILKQRKCSLPHLRIVCMLKALFPKCHVALAASLAENAYGTNKHLEGNIPRRSTRILKQRKCSLPHLRIVCMLKALFPKCHVALAASLAENAYGTNKHLEGNIPRSLSRIERQ